MKKTNPWKRRLFVVVGLILAYGGYRHFEPVPDLPVARTAPRSVFRDAPTVKARRPVAPHTATPVPSVEDVPLMPEEPPLEGLSDADADPALVNDESLAVIDAIIERVGRELDRGVYGPQGSLAYNMVFQFRQSLTAFRRMLEKPLEGPEFSFSTKKEILGRYSTGEQKILLGPDTIDSEGVFLVVLFHEYQHHLHHTIWGSPRRDDVAGLFYNELAAHLFEDLLATYLPKSYFPRPYRGVLPGRLRELLDQGKGEEAMALMLRVLLRMRSEDGRLFYTFLEPVDDGLIDPEELLESVTADFTPDEGKAEALRERLR